MKNYLEIKASQNWFAMAEFSENVDIFRESDNVYVSTIKTNYDFGGNRLCISDNLEFIFTANYHTGVATYSILSGKIVWFNKSLKNVQKIIFFQKTNQLFAITEKNILYILDAQTGEQIEVRKKVQDMFEGSDNDYFYVTNSNIVYSNFVQSFQLFEIANTPLAISRYNENIIISEMYQPLRCYNKTTKQILWESSIPKGNRFNDINAISNTLISGVASYNSGSEDEKYLYLIDCGTGESILKTQLPNDCNFTYFDNGLKLLSSNGDIYDTMKHIVVKKYN